MVTNKYANTKAVEEAPAVQQNAGSPGLLVTTGLDEYWTHCAVCGASPDGHYSDGSVRWNGGTVYVTPMGEKNEYAYACQCAAGRSLNEHQNIPFFWQIHALMGATFHAEIPHVVRVRDKALRVPTLEAREQLNNACFKQVQRFFRGEIDAKGLAENVEHLMNRTAPDRKPFLGIDDLLLSEPLWRLYFSGVHYPHAEIQRYLANRPVHD